MFAKARDVIGTFAKIRDKGVFDLVVVVVKGFVPWFRGFGDKQLPVRSRTMPPLSQ